MMEFYDEENDILFAHWGKEKTEHSVELMDGKVILDFDKEGKLVGIEISGYGKELEKHNERIKKYSTKD